jgi:hypothetical protein
LFLTGTQAPKVILLFPLPGFYWAVRDKGNRGETALRVITLELIWLVGALMPMPFLGLPGIGILLGFWRKKVVWWKAALLPVTVLALYLAASLALTLHGLH